MQTALYNEGLFALLITIWISLWWKRKHRNIPVYKLYPIHTVSYYSVQFVRNRNRFSTCRDLPYLLLIYRDHSLTKQKSCI